MKLKYMLPLLFIASFATVIVSAKTDVNLRELSSQQSSFTSFSVETSDESVVESLNRVSGGDIDLGYSSDSQTYKSENHNVKVKENGVINSAY